MHLKLAAIRSGAEPQGKLPGGASHRWLPSPLACPRCEVTYNLVADWDQSNDRWFAEESAPLIQRLRKAVMMDHSTHHQPAHYETSGMSVITLNAAADPRTLQQGTLRQGPV